uniref:BHLH domain-containing protein n=1 Tax=Bos mutus grunniens TaxID=30521 RepID=A0A8B9XSY4_BOSMU
MALSGPIGARRLLNMHAGLQSAGAGAGPPRAVAKLGLLNCYYRGGPIGAELRSCQHSRPRLRRAAGSHWPRLDPGPAPAARAPAPICCAGRRSPLCVNLRAARRRGGSRALGESAGVWGSGAAGRAGRAASGAGRAAAAAVPKRSRRGRAGGRMELNSLLILLEAAEYLERRDREAEHGYASVLPFDGDFARKKTKAAGLVRKAPNNRRAKLRLYLEQLKQLVPLGPDSTRHTTLSLLKRAKMHIKKLEEQDRRALSIKEQLQREHRFLKRRLEQLSAQSLERVRTDSTGSAVSTDDSEQGGPWGGGLACWQPRGGGGACSRCGPRDGMRKLGRVPQRARDSGGPFGGPALTRPFRSPQKWTSRAWSLAPASWTVWAAAVTWTTTTACGAAAAATAASGPPAGGPAALASRRRCPPRSSARPPGRARRPSGP